MSLARTLPAVTVAVLAASFAAPAAAQDLEPPRRRQGYYITLGAAGAATQAWDEDDKLRLAPGYRLELRVGQLLTRRFGLGLVAGYGMSKRGPEKSTLFGLGLEAHHELVTNLALRGGFGLGVLQVMDSRRYDPSPRGAYGALWAVTLAYDWFPGAKDKSGGFAINPTLSVRGVHESTAKLLVGLVGFEIAYWTGLPRTQLELPESEAYKKK